MQGASKGILWKGILIQLNKAIENYLLTSYYCIIPEWNSWTRLDQTLFLDFPKQSWHAFYQKDVCENSVYKKI